MNKAVTSDAISNQQRLVSTRFQHHVDFWDEVYAQTNLTGVIVQRRLGQALQWIDCLHLAEGANVLDIGCGAGRTSALLMERGYRLHAADAAPAMVERARANLGATENSKVVVEVQDVHALAYPDDTFELIVALGVVPWLHSPRLALAEMARVLVPGGHLIVTANNGARLTYLLDPRRNAGLAPLKKALKRMVRTVRSYDLDDARVRVKMHGIREFDRLLRSVGLLKERSAAFGFGPFTLLGRSLFSERASVRLHNRLQEWADGPVPALRAVANQYIVLAHKP